MKQINIIAAAAIISVIAGCATVDMNKKARTDLAKCKYEVAGIEYESLTKKPEAVNFKVLLAITNPNDNDVALDHVDADLYLDQTKVGTVNHKNFVRIPAKSSVTEPIEVQIPFSAAWILAGSRPQNLTIDATVYVNIMIGKFTLSTPFAVPVKKTVPIPWDKIDKEIDKQKSELGGKVKKLFKK
jgi:LEA14-like dessication related protein